MARPRRDGTNPKLAKRLRLTDIAVGNLKPTNECYFVIDAGGPQGLRIVVHPKTGKKVWKFLYSFYGQKRWYTIGPFPAVGLAEARKRAKQLAGDVARDKDPQGERSAFRDADTFKHMTARYFDEYAKKHNKSWKQSSDLIDKYVLPKWGNTRAAMVTRRAAKELVASIKAPILANQVLAAVRTIFTWGIRQEIVSTNPCLLVDRNPTKSRKRILSDTELPIFWQAFDSAGLIVSTALKVLLLLGQRPGEVASMRYEHIEQNWWEMPGEPIEKLWPGTKNKRAHRVWIPPQVMELIAELIDDDEVPTSGFVFATTSGDAMEAAMAKAMRSIWPTLKAERITPHDFRRTHGSTITRLGFPREAMHRIQNHKEGGIGDVYDVYSYERENRQVMSAVADKITGIVEGTDNVVKGGFREIK